MAKQPSKPGIALSQTKIKIMRPTPPLKNSFKGISGVPSIPESRPVGQKNRASRKDFNPGKES